MTHMLAFYPIAKFLPEQLIEDPINWPLWGNPIWKWLSAIGVAVVAYFVIRLLKGPVARKLLALSKRTKTHVDDLLLSIVSKTLPLFSFVVSVYFGSLVLTLGDKLGLLLKNAALVVLLIQVALWVHKLATALITEAVTQRKEADPATASAFGVIGFFVRLVERLYGVSVPIIALPMGVETDVVREQLLKLIATLRAGNARHRRSRGHTP